MLPRPVVPDAPAPAPMPVPTPTLASAAAVTLALLFTAASASAQTTHGATQETTTGHHTHHPAHKTTAHHEAETHGHGAPHHHAHPAEHTHAHVAEHPHAHVPAHPVTHTAAQHHAATRAASHAAHVAAVAQKPVAKPVPVAPPPPPPPADKGTITGLPLPRFASLRADEVNLRSGPGTRYPIQWVYHRRGLPVQIEREFDVWRLIEDMDGVKGWVNQATLVGNRDVVVTEPLALLRDAPASTGNTVAVLRAGVVGRVLDCAAAPAGAAAEPLSGPASLPAPADPAPPAPPATTDTTASTAPAQAPAPADPAADAEFAQAVASARAGVTRPAPVDAQPGWCHVRVQAYTGWLPRDVFYGLEAGEVIAPS